MADSGGHWLNLAEAQKLTQDNQVPGYMEEDVKRGHLAMLLNAWQLTGTNLVWNREKSVGTGQRASIGSRLVWTDEEEYNQITRPLKIAYKQSPLNNFVEQTYGTFNNYAAIQNRGLNKSVFRLIGDDLIYGDTNNGGSLQPMGIHALAALYPTSLNGEGGSGDLNVNMESGGLSLMELRKMVDAMKHGIDFFLFPKAVARRLDAYVQEAGISNTSVTTSSSNTERVTNSSAAGGTFNFDITDAGARVTAFEDIPIVRSDYLVAEEADTGLTSSSTRDKYSSGTKNYSVFGIKTGQVAFEEPGLTFVFGGDTNPAGALMRTEGFDKLENYDAKGIRKTSYYNLADGSIMALARIVDITDAAVVA